MKCLIFDVKREVYSDVEIKVFKYFDFNTNICVRQAAYNIVKHLELLDLKLGGFGND